MPGWTIRSTESGPAFLNGARNRIRARIGKKRATAMPSRQRSPGRGYYDASPSSEKKERSKKRRDLGHEVGDQRELAKNVESKWTLCADAADIK